MHGRGFSRPAVWAWMAAFFTIIPVVAPGQSRKLAPDVMVTIAPGHEYGDTHQGPVDLPFVARHPELAWQPNTAPVSETLLEMGKRVTFRGGVYCLEFAFKPVRMISVEVPTPAGYRQKTVWYLLYRVRYLGSDYEPVVEPNRFGNKVYTQQPVSSNWVRFMPRFTLRAKGIKQDYLDQIIPAAMGPIAQRERVGSKIYDSVEIQKLKVERSTEGDSRAVWGVAMWTDVDPRTDFFSVEITGLTNAQRIVQRAGELEYQHKTLVLHFSRPGDTVDELADEIRYGIPAIDDDARQQYVLNQFGVEKRLDHIWVYR